VRLGLTWVWLGLEGEDSQYAKVSGIDTRALVRQLQANGTRVLGSTILGLEDHTPENIDAAIEHAVRHNTDFHQFMLYTSLPGTPLWADLSAEGRMKDDSACQAADVHGQSVFNYRHAHIPDGMETELIARAFQRDFEVNGPSVVRIARTMLAGWKRFKDHPDPRIRRRFAWEARDLPRNFSAVVAAARMYYGGNPSLRAKMDKILKGLHDEFGLKSRFYGAVGGPYVYWKMRREEKRLVRGWTYEPPTFYERNEAAEQLALDAGPRAAICRFVTSQSGPGAGSNAPSPMLRPVAPLLAQ
jgi:hypothetical protein